MVQYAKWTLYLSFDLGIQAMAAIPAGCPSEGIGDSDIRVNFGGVTFFSGDYLYADNTGIIFI